MSELEVWKLNDYKMHHNAHVEDSASMQRRDVSESLQPPRNNRLTKYFPMLI